MLRFFLWFWLILEHIVIHEKTGYRQKINNKNINNSYFCMWLILFSLMLLFWFIWLHLLLFLCKLILSLKSKNDGWIFSKLLLNAIKTCFGICWFVLSYNSAHLILTPLPHFITSPPFLHHRSYWPLPHWKYILKTRSSPILPSFKSEIDININHNSFWSISDLSWNWAQKIKKIYQ